MLERHKIPAGGNRAFWISFDFANDGGTENIFSNPLDFQSDAGEIIFTLPNGLHGYMLVDAARQPARHRQHQHRGRPFAAQRQVTNGISCMGCHDGGIKFKKDEIRDFVAGELQLRRQRRRTPSPRSTARRDRSSRS